MKEVNDRLDGLTLLHGGATEEEQTESAKVRPFLCLHITSHTTLSIIRDLHTYIASQKLALASQQFRLAIVKFFPYDVAICVSKSWRRSG